MRVFGFVGRSNTVAVRIRIVTGHGGHIRSVGFGLFSGFTEPRCEHFFFFPRPSGQLFNTENRLVPIGGKKK